MLLSENKVYNFPLPQLRLRVITKEGDDFSSKVISKNSRCLTNFMFRKMCTREITLASRTKT